MTLDPKFRRHLTNARRNIKQAVERASGVDLRKGHAVEGARLAGQVRDEADELIRRLEEKEER